MTARSVAELVSSRFRKFQYVPTNSNVNSIRTGQNNGGARHGLCVTMWVV